jgi:microsomal epoxide hydrolase
LVIAAGSSSELDRQKAETKAIRNARFVQIDDSAHAVFLDQPDRFAAAVANFLSGLRNE